jgi:hypothetical protein
MSVETKEMRRLVDDYKAELASTGWMLLGCALALEQILSGVEELRDNEVAAAAFAWRIAKWACEDLREARSEAAMGERRGCVSRRSRP